MMQAPPSVHALEISFGGCYTMDFPYTHILKLAFKIEGVEMTLAWLLLVWNVAAATLLNTIVEPACHSNQQRAIVTQFTIKQVTTLKGSQLELAQLFLKAFITNKPHQGSFVSIFSLHLVDHLPGPKAQQEQIPSGLSKVCTGYLQFSEVGFNQWQSTSEL